MLRALAIGFVVLLPTIVVFWGIIAFVTWDLHWMDLSNIERWTPGSRGMFLYLMLAIPGCIAGFTVFLFKN